MPRPTTKAELLELSHANFQKLFTFIDGLSDEEQHATFPEGTMNRNVRDVLAHLHAWHELFFTWYQVGLAGQKPAMPAEGYTWKMTSQLNREIWKKCQAIPLAEIRHSLTASHAKVQAVIEAHTQIELFEKKRYSWTGSTSLGAYLISSTSSHYDWAYKLIKKAKK